MNELIIDIIHAIWAGLQPVLDLVYSATLKYWIAGLGAVIAGALFGFLTFWPRRHRAGFGTAIWCLFGIFFGAWLGGMIDGLYPIMKACGRMGLNACIDWAGIAPASILGAAFMLAAFSGSSKKGDD